MLSRYKLFPKTLSLLPKYKRPFSISSLTKCHPKGESSGYLNQYTDKINLENFDYFQEHFFKRLKMDRRDQILFWGSVVLCFGTSIIVFSDGIINFFSKKSATLASKALEDENLKHTTDVMIEEILASEQNQKRVAQLLVNVIQTEEIYQAVLDILLKLGEDPKFVAQLSQVLSTAIKGVINDPERYQELIDLIVKLVNDPRTSAEIIKILKEISADPEMQIATGNHINVALKCALLWGYATSLSNGVTTESNEESKK